MTNHQQNQIKVVTKIEEQIEKGCVKVSTVSPVADFANDPRLCLTGVHFPSNRLKDVIEKQIIRPLQAISPEFYFYPDQALHITIKNIRVINNPPHFTQEDVKKAKAAFLDVIPQHRKFKIYFYRLLLFPNNLALIGTTDPELDKIILDLDQKLRKAGVPDDKQYVNSKYFFCNMTLARFSHPITEQFASKARELSQKINFQSYVIDSVSLITCNAVLNNLHILDTWKLAD